MSPFRNLVSGRSFLEEKKIGLRRTLQTHQWLVKQTIDYTPKVFCCFSFRRSILVVCVCVCAGWRKFETARAGPVGNVCVDCGVTFVLHLLRPVPLRFFVRDGRNKNVSTHGGSRDKKRRRINSTFEKRIERDSRGFLQRWNAAGVVSSTVTQAFFH